MTENSNINANKLPARTDKKLAYAKPDYSLDRDKERKLAHIATRGVTQLFNAVAERQKFVEEKAAEMIGKPRKERQQILEELKQNTGIMMMQQNQKRVKAESSDTKIGAEKTAKRRRLEEEQQQLSDVEPKKEEEQDDDDDDDVMGTSGLSSGLEDTDIEIKDELVVEEEDEDSD